MRVCVCVRERVPECVYKRESVCVLPKRRQARLQNSASASVPKGACSVPNPADQATGEPGLPARHLLNSLHDRRSGIGLPRDHQASEAYAVDRHSPEGLQQSSRHVTLTLVPRARKQDAARGQPSWSPFQGPRALLGSPCGYRLPRLPACRIKSSTSRSPQLLKAKALIL